MKHGHRARSVILCRDPGADSLQALVRMLGQALAVDQVHAGDLDALLAQETHATVRDLLQARQNAAFQDEALLLVICSVDVLCHILALLLQSGCTHFSPLGYLPGVDS